MLRPFQCFNAFFWPFRDTWMCNINCMQRHVDFVHSVLTPAPHFGKYFLKRFTLISRMTNIESHRGWVQPMGWKLGCLIRNTDNPGVTENIAPIEGPGSDVIVEGILPWDNSCVQDGSFYTLTKAECYWGVAKVWLISSGQLWVWSMTSWTPDGCNILCYPRVRREVTLVSISSLKVLKSFDSWEEVKTSPFNCSEKNLNIINISLFLNAEDRAWTENEIVV